MVGQLELLLRRDRPTVQRYRAPVTDIDADSTAAAGIRRNAIRAAVLMFVEFYTECSVRTQLRTGIAGVAARAIDLWRHHGHLRC